MDWCLRFQACSKSGIPRVIRNERWLENLWLPYPSHGVMLRHQLDYLETVPDMCFSLSLTGSGSIRK